MMAEAAARRALRHGDAGCERAHGRSRQKARQGCSGRRLDAGSIHVEEAVLLGQAGCVSGAGCTGHSSLQAPRRRAQRGARVIRRRDEQL